MRLFTAITLFLLLFSISFSELSKFYVKIDFDIEKTKSTFTICFKNISENYFKIPVYEKYEKLNFSTFGKYINCWKNENFVECNFELTREKTCIDLLFYGKTKKEKLNDKIYSFSYSFNIPLIAEEISIAAVLPEKAIIANIENSIFPSNYFLATDPIGRRIVVGWKFDNNGKIDFLTKIIVEVPLEERKTGLIQIISYFVFPIVIVIIIFYYLKFIKKETIESVLNENERKVVEILREKKKIVQKDLVQHLDLSKAKVSRIVKDMEKRGIIEVERRGRNNILKLKKT
ncbi:MAG: winged helix-turn-helix transcriptional regulator [Candidatus Aenigmatarchaeota archaeon]